LRAANQRLAHPHRSAFSDAEGKTRPMNVYRLDPLSDSRWGRLVERHPDSSVFHTPGWLQALSETYGYEPFVYTTSPPEMELTNGIVACNVRSLLTGSRAVSLPFSDHCQPLIDNAAGLNVLIEFIAKRLGKERWKYFELRPRWRDSVVQELEIEIARSDHFLQHAIDLRPDIDTLFKNLQKSSVQRKIRRAEREQLQYEEGHSEQLVREFYKLLILTRRRHGLPPQPLVWFMNLVRIFGDNLKIRMASKDDVPLASILTISHKRTLVYKYGCSDSKFHNLGGMALVLWRAIRDGKQSGAVELDLGRSDATNAGLIAFKENWGSKPYSLDYLRYCGPHTTVESAPHWRRRVVEAIFSRMPSSMLTAAGRLLYPHIG
jgi:hypothetical protein